MKRPLALSLAVCVGLALAHVACDGGVEVGSDDSDAGKPSAPCVGGSCPSTTAAASSSRSSPTPSVSSTSTSFSTSAPTTTVTSRSASSGDGQTSASPTSTSTGTCVPETCEQANKTGMCGGVFPDGCGGHVVCGCESASSSTATGTSSTGRSSTATSSTWRSSTATSTTWRSSTATETTSTSAAPTCPGPPDGGDCVPKTCAAVGAICGVICDDCGGIIDCGTCEDAGASASSASTTEGCDCCPATCASLGVACGPVGDGCGGLLICGDYGPWTTTTLHGGTPCVISDGNRVYTQCEDGSAIATIVLGAGEQLQNATINVLGETEGATASLTGDVAGPGGVGVAETGTVVSTNDTPASSTPSGSFIAGAFTGATVSFEVIQSFSPNVRGTIQFDVSYQTRSCVTSSASTSASTSDAGSSAGCAPLTCASQGTSCGSIPDGCGGLLDCGACADAGTTSSG